MLKKRHRLNLALSENAAIFQRGRARRFYSDFFIAYTRDNSESLLVSLVVPQACEKSAARRNALRRRLSIVLEEELKSFHPAPQKDVAIVLKRHFSPDFFELQSDLRQLCANFTKS